MKNIHSAVKLVLFVVWGVSWGLALEAAESVAGPYVRGVAGADATLSGPFRIDPMPGVLVKDGTGTQTLPLAALRSRASVNVDVTAGRLSLVPGTDATFDRDTPPTAMQKAALWLDAGLGVVYADSTARTVTRWYDRREVKTGETWGTDYLCANINPGNEQATAKTVYPVSHAVGSDPAIWFHGKGSGSTMAFYAKDRSGREMLRSIRHVFIVHAVTNSAAALLGTYKGTELFFNPGSSTYQVYNTAQIGVHSGLASYDGKRVDLSGTVPTAGRHLVEWHTGGALGLAGAFFDDRGYSGTSGGDDLCEVVLFTVSLTEAERMEISEWLSRKWLGSGYAPSSVALRTAPGSELAVDATTTGALASVTSVGGSATLVKTGSDELKLSFAGSAPAFGSTSGFTGGVRVEGGTLKMNAADVAYALADGDSVTAEAASGQTLSVTQGASAAAGCVVKQGTGPLRIESLPQGVTNLAFSGGTLTLGSAAVRRTFGKGGTTVGAVAAAIKNPGFENLYTAANTTVGGGTIGTSDWYVVASFARVFDRSRMTSETWLCDEGSPEGNYALAIKQTASRFYTWVDLPVDGAYDLTFKTCGRTSQAGMTFDISLIDEKNVATSAVGRCIVSPANGYKPRLFRTPKMTAGRYKLDFALLTSHDAVSCFDDFKMTRVAEEADTQAYAIPNGGFEGVLPTGTSSATSYTAANTVTGWTLGDSASTEYLDVGAVLHGDGNGLFNTYAPNGGSVQLMFVGSAGSAVSDAFSMPALPSGKYKLRLRCCHWGASYWSAIKNVLVKTYPRFAVTLSVNGTAFELGSVTSETHSLDLRTLPNEVELKAGDTLALTLRQTATVDGGVAVGLVDDLEFVRSGEKTELVTNGDFEKGTWESADGWTLAANKNEAVASLKNGRARLLLHTRSDLSYVGSDRCAATSTGCLDIGQAGSARQTVTFDSGSHWLSFYTRCRPGYGGNSLKVLIARGGVTNEIARLAAVTSSVFLKQEFLFTVPEAGDWTFILAGANENCGNDTWLFVDNVSVKRVPDSVDPVFDVPAKTLQLNLGAGTKVRLDFTNTVQAAGLRVNGRRFSGLLDATHPSGLVTGPGAIYAERRDVGLYVIVK